MNDNKNGELQKAKPSNDGAGEPQVPPIAPGLVCPPLEPAPPRPRS